MAISGSETLQSTPAATKPSPQVEVQTVKCHSCGLTEDCTPPYISLIRERYQGRWICGLCIEAVKYELVKSEKLISTEEALNRHISICKEFKSSNPQKETEHPIFVMSRILRRSLDSSPRAIRSNSISVLPDVDKIDGSSLVRSESCFSSFPGR